MAVTTTRIELTGSMVRALLTIRESVDKYHQLAFTDGWSHRQQGIPESTGHALAARGLARLELTDGAERFDITDNGRWVLSELCPWTFTVTHPYQDAPDGSVLFIESRYGTYGRSGPEWDRLGDGDLVFPDSAWHDLCPATEVVL